MRTIVYLRHPEFDPKTGQVTEAGWKQLAVLTPIILALFKEQDKPRIWTSSEIRAQDMGQKIAGEFGGVEAEEHKVLNTVKWEGEHGVPGCTAIYRGAKRFLAENPDESIVTAILAAEGGMAYLKGKVKAILASLATTTGNLAVVAHESSVEGIAWSTLGLPFGSSLPAGHIRYTEGLVLREVGGALKCEILRNPYYD